MLRAQEWQKAKNNHACSKRYDQTRAQAADTAGGETYKPWDGSSAQARKREHNASYAPGPFAIVLSQ